MIVRALALVLGLVLGGSLVFLADQPAKPQAHPLITLGVR